MTCHANAFEIDDRVVVQFTAGDWAQPRVIGFLDNPKPCETYSARYWEQRFVSDAYDPAYSWAGQALPTVLISEQDSLPPTATLDDVTARAPGGIHPFYGWRIQTSTYNNITKTWSNTVSWNQGLTLSLGTLQRRVIIATATYANPQPIALGWQWTSFSWASGPTLVENPPGSGIMAYTGSISGNYRVYMVGSNDTMATGTETSAAFWLTGSLTAGDYVTRLPEPDVQAAVPSFSVALPHAPTSTTYTFTYTHYGYIAALGSYDSYIPSAVDRLMP